MFPFDLFGSPNEESAADPIVQTPEAESDITLPEPIVLVNNITGEVLSPEEVLIDGLGNVYLNSPDYIDGNNPHLLDPMALPGETNAVLYSAEELGYSPVAPISEVSVVAETEVVTSEDSSSAAVDSPAGSDGDSEGIDSSDQDTFSSIDSSSYSYDSSDSGFDSSYDSSGTASSDWSSSSSSYDNYDSGWDSSSSDWSSSSDYDSSSDW